MACMHGVDRDKGKLLCINTPHWTEKTPVGLTDYFWKGIGIASAAEGHGGELEAA